MLIPKALGKPVTQIPKTRLVKSEFVRRLVFEQVIEEHEYCDCCCNNENCSNNKQNSENIIDVGNKTEN